MRDSSRGGAGCGAALEDLAAPVALRGAMALSVGGLFVAGGWIARVDWRRKFFGRGAAAEMCCERGGGAFSAKL
jgi:hypothetical protein